MTRPSAPLATELPDLRDHPLNADEFFAVQSTRTADLPDPLPLLNNLTRCVLEILHGARDLDQIMRWVTDEVYQSLLRRVVIAERARAVKGQPVRRPQLGIVSTRTMEPRDGVVEATIIVRTPTRVRAVAIRLEGLDKRWRASAISVL